MNFRDGMYRLSNFSHRQYLKVNTRSASFERTTHLRERADDRDSEPDYLLRPTRHGPGDCYRSSEQFFLTIGHLIADWGHRLNRQLNDRFSNLALRFESVINTRGSFGCSSPPLSTFCVRYTRRVLKATEEEILQGQSTEARSSHSNCILQPYILYGQTPSSSHGGSGRSPGRGAPSPCAYLRDAADDDVIDYLLRPTMHGPGGTLLIIAHSFLEHRSQDICWRL